MSIERLPTPIEDLLAHRDWVRALARSLVADVHRADDLEQETWVRALAHPPSRTGSARGWLRRVLRNVWIDTHRSERQRGIRELAASRPERTTPGDVVAQTDAHRRVVQAAYDLDEPYRTTLLLRYFEGLSVRDVARRTGVPDETAKTRLRRALERMRARLDAGADGADDWRAAIVPLLVGTGGWTMKSSAKSACVAAVLLALAGGGAWWGVASWTGDADADIATGPGRTGTTELTTPLRSRAAPDRGARSASAPFAGSASARGEARTRADGRPAAGARVVLAARDDPGFATSNGGAARGAITVVAGDDGQFEFVSIAPDRAYTVSASTQAASAVPSRVAPLRDAETRDLGVVWLDATGSIDVTVTAVAGSPEGALAEAFGATTAPWGASGSSTQADDRRNGGVPVASGRADADGRVRLTRVPSGPVRLVVRRELAVTTEVPWVEVAGGRTTPVTVLLEVATPLEGRVVDAARRAVPGLTLSARPTRVWFGSSGLAASAHAVADADGRFRFDGLRAGPVMVDLVTTAGLVPLGRVRSPADVPYEFVVAWRAVEGVVLDAASRAPVPGATVRAELYVSEGIGSVETTTDAAGTYRLESPVAANYVGLHATAPGRAPSAPSRIDIVRRPGAGETLRVDLEVAESANVEGTVTCAGAPVGGAWVHVYWGDAGNIVRRETTTDAAGRYAARDVPAGRVAVVQVHARGLAQTRFDAQRYVMVLHGTGAADPAWSFVGAPGRTARFDVEMTAGRTVAGRVVDRAGAPVAGARVVAGGTASDVTDERGAFRVAGVPPSETTIYAWTAELAHGSADVAADADVAGAEIRIESPRLLTGRVRVDGGGPLPVGVVVRMIQPESIGPYDDESDAWDRAPPVRVAADGTFSATTLAHAKSVKLRADAPGWVTPTPLAVVVEGAAADRRIELGIAPAPRFEGRVVDDATDAPVAGARIALDLTGGMRPGRQFVPRSPEPVATSDANGRFVAAELRAGRFSGRVAADGFVARTFDAVVPSAEDTVLRLRRAERLFAGRVVGPDGRPVADASVTAHPEDAGGDASAETPWATTRADGTFEVAGAARDGTWCVQACPPSGGAFPSRWVRVDGVAVGRTDVEIVLRAARRIAGRVFGSDGAPARGVTVSTTFAAGGVALPTARTGDDGSFVLEGLDDVRYGLRVDAPCDPAWDVSVAICRDLVAIVADVPAGAEDLVVRLERGASVAGTLEGGDGRPVADAWIVAFVSRGDDAARARRPGGRNATGARTDAAGRFSIGGIPPGRVRLLRSVPATDGDGRAYLPLTGGEDVAAGATGVKLREATYTTVAGRVVDEAGDGVVGARIEVCPTGRPRTAVGSATTAADGTFHVERLDASHTFTVHAWKPGALAPAAVADVAPGAADVALRLSRGLTVSGRLTDAAGQPLPGIYELVPEGDGRTTQFETTADGRFDVRGLTPGTWRVETRVVRRAGTRYVRGAATVHAGDMDAEVRIIE